MSGKQRFANILVAAALTAALMVQVPSFMAVSYAAEEEEIQQEVIIDDQVNDEDTVPEAGEQITEESEQQEPVLKAKSEGAEEDPVLTPVVNGEGTILLSKDDPAAGENVTVTANAGNGYYLAQIRIGSAVTQPEQLEQPEMEYQVLQRNGNTASFEMPETDTTVFADFVSVAWDGTIDLTWYDPDDSTIKISYPAQLEGAAALTAGLFNDIPTREITDNGKTASIPDISDEEGAIIELDETEKTGYVSTDNGSGYQTFGDIDGDGIDTTVVGDLSLLKIGHKKGEVGSNNQVTSSFYWFGGEDFTGKTIVLKRDLDMGGRLNGSLKTVMDNWSGPNYMPLGGQYSMDSNNGYTRLTAGFNGVFDGQGHMVYNIFAARHAPSATFGNCQSVGLIGLLGIYHVEDGTVSKPAVRNVAIDGFINGNRSIGGIVGKTVHAKGAVIENCVNFATVYNTDAKGCGGIVGAAWFDTSYGDLQPQICNCANLGLVCTGYNKNAGGLIGSNEAIITDSYTIGYATGEGKGNDNAGQALGTNNGGAVWYNCYTLRQAGSGNGSVPGSNTQQVYGSTSTSAIRVLDDVTVMKRAETIGLLNGKVRNNGPDENGYMDSDDDVIQNTKRNWTSGENTASKQFISSHMINSLNGIVSWRNPQTAWPDADAASSEFTLAAIASRLTAVDGEGLPIPRVFFNDESTLEDIVTTGTPTKEYLAGEFFDTGDHSNQSTGPDESDENCEFSVWAVFSDGSYQEIDNYSVVYEGGSSEFTNNTEEEIASTQVTISGTYLGRGYSFVIDGISVTKCDFLSMDVTAQPNNLLYAKGEAFDPDGLVISEDYGKKGEGEEADDIKMTIKAEFKNNQLEVTKRIKRANSSDYNEYKLSGESADAFEYVFDDDRYSLEAGKTEMIVRHTFNNNTKTVKFPVTVLNSDPPRVWKDGENDRQVVYIDSADDFTWFANQIATGIDPGMWAELETDITFDGEYPVGTRKGKISEQSNSYEGDFNGKGHTITLDISRGSKCAGLFYEIGSGGCVHDLTVAGSVAGGANTGAIAAYISGGSITACVCNVDVTGNNKNVGGIAGNMRLEGSSITECRNTGTVKGNDGVGGIAGIISNPGTISKCVNTGKVYSDNTSTPSIGGIVGIANNGTIEQSRNSGIVSGNGGGRLGGIAGSIGSNNVLIGSCYNQGNIIGTGISSSANAGGIIGLIGSSYKNCTVEHCYNSGEMYCPEDRTNVGTLVGKTSGFSRITNNCVLQDPLIAKAIVTSSGTPEESNAEALSAKKLKIDGAGKLGETYSSVKEAYPILAWENVDTVLNDAAALEQKTEALKRADSSFALFALDRLESKVEKLSEKAASSKADAETIAAVPGEQAVIAAQVAYDDALEYLAKAQQLSSEAESILEYLEGPDEIQQAQQIQQEAVGLLTAAEDAVSSAETLLTQTKNEASNALEITLSSSTYTYTGSEITPDVTVTSGDKTVSGENYTVQYADNVNAGQATVTVSFTGELYQGTRSIDFTINKAANTMKASGKTVKVKYKKLKKKNQKVVRSKVMAVSGNQGAVTYVKISGHKKILIDGSTGNVTVKKKLKKKTYSVSVRVTAAGDANHYAATKVVTFKVKVK